MTSISSDLEAREPWGWEDRLKWLELDFSEEEFRRRISGVQDKMGEREIDGLVVYGRAGDEDNVRYLSGFPSWWGDSIVVLARSGEPALITTAIFHGEPMHSNVQKTWIRDLRPLLNPQSTSTPRTGVDVAADFLKSHGAAAGRIAYAHSAKIPARILDEISSYMPSAEIVDGSDLVMSMRQYKSDEEIDVIKRLGAITSAGMDAGMDAVRPGVTESYLAGQVHGACVAAGAERMDFGCFSLSGPRGFMKNVWPRADKEVEADEVVVFDVGTKLAGYQHDMSRNVVAGSPSPEVRAMLEACLEAQEVGLQHTASGVTIGSVLSVMQGVIADHGFSHWDWTTSHGFGQLMLEWPIFYPGNTHVLEPRMTFFIEPMIVPPEVGTICIEDSVLVTEDGCGQMTTSRKREW